MKRAPEKDTKQSSPENNKQYWKVSGDVLLKGMSGSGPMATANTVPLLMARKARTGKRLLYQAPLAKFSLRVATLWLPQCLGEGSWCSKWWRDLLGHCRPAVTQKPSTEGGELWLCCSYSILPWALVPEKGSHVHGCIIIIIKILHFFQWKGSIKPHFLTLPLPMSFFD